MPKQYGRHGVPQKTHPLKVVVGCLALIALVACGIFAVRYLSGQHAQSVYTQPEGAQTNAQSNTQSQTEVERSTQTTGTVSALESSVAEKAEAAAQPKKKEEEPKPTVEPATVEIMMIGDILMHDEPVQSGAVGDGTYDFGFIFDHIRSYIDAAQVRILNQETVMGDPSLGYALRMGEVGPIMNTPTDLADTEANYGFNLILKATNHTYDLGYEGLAHELDYWKAAHPEIPVIGVNNPNAADDDQSQNYVDNVYVTEVNGLKIGFLNYTWATNLNYDWDTDQRFISYMSEEKIKADVQKARDAGAEMLVACPHWGIQYTTTPSDEEYTYSKIFCDAGVDVIFGCHPHILQPVELLQNADGHKCVCFYSNGNFVAGGAMETTSLLGGIARTTLQRNADGTYAVSAASLVPTVICYTYGPNMSAFPILEWNNDLAAQSVRSELTVDYAHAFCADLYGEQYDPNAGVVTLDLASEPRTV